MVPTIVATILHPLYFFIHSFMIYSIIHRYWSQFNITVNDIFDSYVPSKKLT